MNDIDELKTYLIRNFNIIIMCSNDHCKIRIDSQTRRSIKGVIKSGDFDNFLGYVKNLIDKVSDPFSWYKDSIAYTEAIMMVYCDSRTAIRKYGLETHSESIVSLYENLDRYEPWLYDALKKILKYYNVY